MKKACRSAASPWSSTASWTRAGSIATLLGSIGLLSGKQDDLGYTQMGQPFHLGGTLNAIDASQWQAALVKSALHKATGGLLDKLLGSQEARLAVGSASALRSE